jgi:hypothetical protein
MKNKLFCSLAIALSVLSASASASSLKATLVVIPSVGSSWVEDLSSQMDTLNSGVFGQPDMYYDLSAANITAPSVTYQFTIESPIAPLVGGASSVYAEIMGSMLGAKGVMKSIVPVYSSGVQRVELSADNGKTFFSANVGTGPAISGTGALTSYSFLGDPFWAGNSAGLTGPTWNYVRILSDFTVSGSKSFSLSGYATIKPVPEPLEGAMLLAGLALVASVVRNRRKVALG